MYRLTAQGAASFGADSDIGADIRLVRAILNRPTRPRGGFVGSDHLQRYWDRTSSAQRSGLPAYVVLYQVGHEANPADLSQPDILTLSAILSPLRIARYDARHSDGGRGDLLPFLHSQGGTAPGAIHSPRPASLASPSASMIRSSRAYFR